MTRLITRADLDTLGRPPGCDSPTPPSVYYDGDVGYRCRDVVCPRCGHHTGSVARGHTRTRCAVTGVDCTPHLCCPGEAGCELR